MTRAIPLHRRFMLLFVVCLVLLVAQGCMYSPQHNQEYLSRSSTIYFNGFVPIRRAAVEIYVQAWDDPSTCGVVRGDPGHWQLLGSTKSSFYPTHDTEGNSWYHWHFETLIPTENWCLLPTPVGGTAYSTNVYGRYRRNVVGEPWHDLLTVEKDYLTCAQQQGGNGFKIAENCTRKGDGSHAVQVWAAE